jgi:hypothetical protein
MNTSLGKLTKVTASQAAGQNKKIKADKAKFDQTLNQLQPAPQLATTNLLQSQQTNNSLAAGKQMSTDDVATSKLKKLNNLVTIQSVKDSTEQTKTKNSSIINVNRLADDPSTFKGIDKATDASTSFQLPISVKENTQSVTAMQEALSRSTVVTDQPTTSPIINNSAEAKQPVTGNTTQPTTVKENAQPVTAMQESRPTVVIDQPATSPIITNSVEAKQPVTGNTTQPTTVKENTQSVTAMQEALSRSTVVTDQPTTSPIINNSAEAKQPADLTGEYHAPTTVKENAQPVTAMQEALSTLTDSTNQPAASMIITKSVEAADLAANTTQPVATMQEAKIMDSVDAKQKEVSD